jgi:hypothetical protein
MLSDKGFCFGFIRISAENIFHAVDRVAAE